MKVPMMFPGQGSQFVGIGKDYYDAFPAVRDLYDRANQALGFDIAELSFTGEMETLTETRNAQPAILLHSLAILTVLAERGVSPSVVAGHSLGEFSALVAAESLDPIDAVKIVRRRGELMFEAGLKQPGTMAAVIGLDQDKVEAVVGEVGRDGVVVVANYNSPAQFAISGEVDAVEAACPALKEAGAKRALRLPVSGAFHSPLMEPTVPEFRGYLESFDIGKVKVPWVANVTARVENSDADVIDLLARQLSSPVRWTDSMAAFAGVDGSPAFEVGPGKVLTGLMKRIVPDVNVATLSSTDDLAAAALGV